MKMRSLAYGGPLGLCLVLVLSTVNLLLNPITAMAGECTAKCKDGTKVTCSGKNCTATDDEGCDAVGDTKKCPKSDLEFQ